MKIVPYGPTRWALILKEDIIHAKFETKEEAEMALNLLNMGTEVGGETQNAENETQSSNETTSHYGWLEEEKDDEESEA